MKYYGYIDGHLRATTEAPTPDNIPDYVSAEVVLFLFEVTVGAMTKQKLMKYAQCIAHICGNEAEYLYCIILERYSHYDWYDRYGPNGVMPSAIEGLYNEIAYTYVENDYTGKRKMPRIIWCHHRHGKEVYSSWAFDIHDFITYEEAIQKQRFKNNNKGFN